VSFLIIFVLLRNVHNSKRTGKGGNDEGTSSSSPECHGGKRMLTSLTWGVRVTRVNVIIENVSGIERERGVGIGGVLQNDIVREMEALLTYQPRIRVGAFLVQNCLKTTSKCLWKLDRNLRKRRDHPGRSERCAEVAPCLIQRLTHLCIGTTYSAHSSALLSVRILAGVPCDARS
jgi:hypothetical protein